MKNLIPILFATGCILLLGLMAACNNKVECDNLENVEENYYLPQKYIDSFPYTGKDSLVFLSDQNDTAIFVGTGKKFGHTEFESTFIGSADCPRYRKIYADYAEYTYYSNKIALNELILILKTGYQYTTTPYCLLNFYVMNQNEVMDYYDDLVNKSASDSIFYKGNFVSGAYARNSDILYNKNLGILRFKEMNGKQWTLIYKN